MNTVHVIDVCKALWHLTTNGESGNIYNLCDKADSCMYHKIFMTILLLITLTLVSANDDKIQFQLAALRD